VALYEKTIQSRSAKCDALGGEKRLEEQLEAEGALVAAEQRRYGLADVRYRNGVESTSPCLPRNRTFIRQQRILQSRLRACPLDHALQALGGGWDREQSSRATAMISPSDANR